MIRGLILFYLNIKPTHGYEIQRFIQISGMDQWTKVQSGSIYYALTKLEKEKNIEVLREERTGSRVRKIYQITEKGRETLRLEMKAELAEPISSIGSLKFVIEPMMNTLEKEESISILIHHIEELEEKRRFWKQWQEVKAGASADRLSQLSFEMAIHSMEDQILWHKELLENLDKYREKSEIFKEVIASFEADMAEEAGMDEGAREKIEFIEQIKQTLEKDPQAAMENLNQMILQMKEKK